MKLFLKLIAVLLFPLVLGSCNNSVKKPSPIGPDQKEISENQVYDIDDSGISIVWTAYKFTDKVAVSGTFEEYTISKKNVSGPIENILNGLQISIPTESIETENAVRDFKITTYFFDVFNTASITGTVLKAKDGEGDIRLRMNKISLTTPFTYSLENDSIRLFTHLDLTKWKGEKAMEVLNKECFELHKGTDGISKLWPDVDVVIKLPLKKVSKID